MEKSHEKQSLPPPTGMYSVGLRIYEWERFSGDTDGASRHLVASVWFPVEKSCLTAVFPVEEDLTLLMDYSLEGKYIMTELWSSLKQVSTSSFLNETPFDHAAGSVPFLVYSHGVGMNRTAGILWCEELASHGFIVLSLDHVGFAATSKESSRFPFNREKVIATPIMEIRTIYHQDIKYVIDAVETGVWNDDISRLIDHKRIGIFGHSIGGGAAWQLLWQDHRIMAAISMDGFLTNRVFHKVQNSAAKPLLILFGDQLSAIEEPQFYPSECGPGLIPTDDMFCPNLISVQKSPIRPTIRVSAQLPESNVVNVSFPNCGHFAFTNRILLKDCLLSANIDSQNDSKRGIDVDVNDAVGTRIWDILGVDGNINAEQFITCVRNIIIIFFKHNLSLNNASLR